MVFKKKTVLPRQSVWDLCIEHYGSVEGLQFLLTDNSESCNLETTPVPGTIILIREPINKKVVEFFEAREQKPATAVEEPYDPDEWILFDGTWNDDKFWVDNALWID